MCRFMHRSERRTACVQENGALRASQETARTVRHVKRRTAANNLLCVPQKTARFVRSSRRRGWYTAKESMPGATPKTVIMVRWSSGLER